MTRMAQEVASEQQATMLVEAAAAPGEFGEVSTFVVAVNDHG